MSTAPTVGEEQLEAYLSRRTLPFERHPEIPGVTTAKRVDFLVLHPIAPFLCEVKDIDSWRIVEKLEQTPGAAQWIDPQLDLGRARSHIIDATDKQLNPYAGTYPLVVALSQAAASDADLSRFAMLELLIGRNTLTVSRQTREAVEQLVPNDYHGLFYLERNRGTGWRYRTGALAAVLVIDEGGDGVEVYLNPRCESLPLDPAAFDGANDRVLGPMNGGAAYGRLR